MALFQDLTGKVFNGWTILSFSHRKDLGKYHYQMFICKCICGNERVVESTSIKKGNSVSCGCLRKENSKKGKNCYQWKENGLGYWGIHQWLRKHYGSANKCESQMIGIECGGKSETFNWSKLQNKQYERKRENFIQLCRSCHNKYDMTQGTKDKISLTMKEYIKSKKK